MKWIMACVVGVCLLLPLGTRRSFADMVPRGPVVPERKTPLESKTASMPVYAVAAGVVAVAMAGSLIALRVIRKRNDA